MGIDIEPERLQQDGIDGLATGTGEEGSHAAPDVRVAEVIGNQLNGFIGGLEGVLLELTLGRLPPDIAGTRAEDLEKKALWAFPIDIFART